METFIAIVVIIIFIALCVRFANFLINPLTTKLETTICPFCKSRIPIDAVTCKYCRKDIEPEKEMKAEDIGAYWELRKESVNKVLEKFRSEHPEVDFRFDTTLGDITIKVPSSRSEPKPKSEDIQEMMINELRNLGVKAEARFLSKDTIKTKGFIEGIFENVSEEIKKGQSPERK